MYKTVFIGLLIITAFLQVDALRTGALGLPKTIDVAPLPFMMSWLFISLLTWVGIVIAALYVGYQSKENGWLYAGLTGVIWVVLLYSFMFLSSLINGVEASAGIPDPQTVLSLLTLISSLLVGGVSMVLGFLGGLIRNKKLLQSL